MTRSRAFARAPVLALLVLAATAGAGCAGDGDIACPEGTDRFVEVFLNPPFEVCRARDRAGLYEAADLGEIREFPGVSASYDEPDDADLVLDTARLDVDSCVQAVIGLLEARGFIPPGGTPRP